MKVQDWLKALIKKGLVCKEYSLKIVQATSKAKMVDVLLDANGITFLCEMCSKGYVLPYETIIKEFKGFLNGNYVAVYKGEGGVCYDSCFYCCYSEGKSINIKTTQTLFLGCNLDVYIKENDFVKLVVDRNSKIKVHCPKTSRCTIDCWKGSEIKVAEPKYNNVDIKEEE